MSRRRDAGNAILNFLAKRSLANQVKKKKGKIGGKVVRRRGSGRGGAGGGGKWRKGAVWRKIIKSTARGAGRKRRKRKKAIGSMLVQSGGRKRIRRRRKLLGGKGVRKGGRRRRRRRRMMGGRGRARAQRAKGGIRRKRGGKGKRRRLQMIRMSQKNQPDAAPIRSTAYMAGMSSRQTGPKENAMRSLPSRMFSAVRKNGLQSLTPLEFYRANL